ncbi:MAG: homoserine dehydrogenase, partial [Candidatus Omnitrophica bacterium]|nr:homoserine dehydrogenase [Candidatus Omnitrophota bacterium]
INIGVIGFGSIGSGVVKLLLSGRRLFRDRTGIDLNLALVCDKDLRSRRDVSVPKKMLTRDANKVIHHPDIDVVVELIGGVHPAKEIVMKALTSGKHVVTANKLLLASEGEAIFKKAKEVGREIFFEASVAGGIPIIKSIREGLQANTFYSIMGILNGTSNYILSRMSSEGASFKAALKEAQSKGFAENNPSLDIKGVDSANKLAILSLLAFGKKPNMKDIYGEGIEGISPVDIQYAKEWGYTVKLLAIAKREGNQLGVRVHPTLLSSKYLLSSVSGAYNAIFIDADLVGKQVYYGQGAGKLPTASAILSDIMDIADAIIYGKKSSCLIAAKRAEIKKIKKIDDMRIRYYVHFSTIDRPGVLAKIAGILGDYGISIASVVQKERREAHVVPIVMLTHEAREKDMQDALKKINNLVDIKRKSILLRLES